jgi:hypothetical protein
VRYLILIVLLVAAACAPTARRQSAEEAFAEYRAQLAAKAVQQQETLGAIWHESMPKDYRKQIDARLVQRLKDPDSRKVEFGTTAGGLACGTVNAKNSYGGYTGKQIFTAVFKSGTLADLDISSLEDAKLIVNGSVGELGNTGGVTAALFRRCGVS